MLTMNLRPLPVTPSGEAPEHAAAEMDGFVDEEVISRLIAHPRPFNRPSPRAADLVLPADEWDFAARSTPVESPFQPAPEEPPVQEVAPFTRPQAPLPEAGIGQPHRGDHRWWLAALAGAFSALVLSSLFFVLSWHPAEPDSAPLLSKPWLFLDIPPAPTFSEAPSAEILTASIPGGQ